MALCNDRSMPGFSHTAVVDAPPARVYAHLADPRSYVGLSPLVVAVRDVRSVGAGIAYVAVERFRLGPLHWDNPIQVITNVDSDKNWITCDNTASSPYYGNCYVEWDNPDEGDVLYMPPQPCSATTSGTLASDAAAGL